MIILYIHLFIYLSYDDLISYNKLFYAILFFLFFNHFILPALQFSTYFIVNSSKCLWNKLDLNYNLLLNINCMVIGFPFISYFIFIILIVKLYNFLTICPLKYDCIIINFLILYSFSFCFNYDLYYLCILIILSILSYYLSYFFIYT